jgi:hypothetical protein
MDLRAPQEVLPRDGLVRHPSMLQQGAEQRKVPLVEQDAALPCAARILLEQLFEERGEVGRRTVP